MVFISIKKKSLSGHLDQAYYIIMLQRIKKFVILSAFAISLNNTEIIQHSQFDYGFTLWISVN